MQGVIAPLPHGDPFECFARGLDGVLARMGAACEAGNATLQGVGVAALEAVGKLGLAVASLQPLQHTPWSYAFPHYSVQVIDVGGLGSCSKASCARCLMKARVCCMCSMPSCSPYSPRFGATPFPATVQRCVRSLLGAAWILQGRMLGMDYNQCVPVLAWQWLCSTSPGVYQHCSMQVGA